MPGKKKDGSSRKRKSTSMKDLPPNKKDQSSVRGGKGGLPTRGAACTTGLMSTCSVQDTKIDTWCGANC